jgi:hypothetical protein
MEDEDEELSGGEHGSGGGKVRRFQAEEEANEGEEPDMTFSKQKPLNIQGGMIDSGQSLAAITQSKPLNLKNIIEDPDAFGFNLSKMLGEAGSS